MPPCCRQSTARWPSRLTASSCRPLFFPGGDIGKLSVLGTVNDLAVAGAAPLWLSLALILEEGLPLEVLDRVLASIAAAACEAKVCDRHRRHQGRAPRRGRRIVHQYDRRGSDVAAAVCRAGRVAGRRRTVGDRPDRPAWRGRDGRRANSWRFSRIPASDCASLVPAVEALRRSGVPMVSLRDATRGGVSAVLHEWAAACGRTLAIDDPARPGHARGRAESASCWASIRCTSPTKARWSRPSAPDSASKPWTHCDGCPSRAKQPSLATCDRRAPRRCWSNADWAATFRSMNRCGALLPRIC